MTPRKKEYWSRKDVVRLLGIKKGSIGFFEKAGAPAYDKEKGGYPATEYCEFVINRPRKSRGPDKTNIRELCQRYLMGEKLKPVIQEPEEEKEDLKLNDKKGVGRPRKEPPPEINLRLGMVEALNRAREAEVAAYKTYAEVLEKTGVISVASLDSWQKALDILRKCETDFGKALERSRELVETKEVQDWLEPMLEQTKTMLLNLPAKLAPSLEGLEWFDIQERLDKEIRDVIAKLSNFS